jgi:hypothetical protein
MDSETQCSVNARNKKSLIMEGMRRDNINLIQQELVETLFGIPGSAQ